MVSSIDKVSYFNSNDINMILLYSKLGRVGKTWYEVRRIAIEGTEWNTHVAAIYSKYELKGGGWNGITI